MSNEKYLHELHADHRQWLGDLGFAEEELQSFTYRLEELVKANSKTEVTARIEQFQNQFIREREVIDELKHDIKLHEKELAENAQANNIATDHRKVADRVEIRERMESFYHIFDSLKADFQKFLAETL